MTLKRIKGFADESYRGIIHKDQVFALKITHHMYSKVILSEDVEVSPLQQRGEREKA